MRARAPDPYTGTHELDVQWVEDSTWTYTASFVRQMDGQPPIQPPSNFKA